MINSTARCWLFLLKCNSAVTNGQSRYFKDDALTTEWDDIFILRFDDDGRCIEYREWYIERPKN